jgi:xylulokinase
LVELVGNAALAGFTLPKLLWIRKHLPRIWEATACFMLPKDFVRLKLTGEAATDVGDASGILLFDVVKRGWSDRAIQAFGIERRLLARVVESCEVAGRITAWAAGETGLKEGTLVVGGSGDNQCGAVGAGVVSPGVVLATLGTSGVMFAHAGAPKKDLPGAGAPSGRLHTMCSGTGTASDRTGWCITGCMLSAAGCLQWVHDKLFPGLSYDELFAEAAGAPPGCEGLIFLPYLTGERCPYPNPEARGGWIGLTSRHTRAHLVRAVIEGVTFAMGQILDLVRSTGVPVERVLLGGGGAKSALWRQLQADVYGIQVETTNAEEGPAFGAALMAAVGVGAYASVPEACEATISTVGITKPSATEYGASRAKFGEGYARVNS